MALKIASFDPYMEESIDKYNPFKRELLFYEKILPDIEDLLLSVGDSTKLTETYATASGSRD